jgi:hypothetical protein
VNGLDNACDYKRAKMSQEESLNPEVATGHILQASERRLYQLLLARFIILKLFAEEARRSQIGLQPKEH